MNEYDNLLDDSVNCLLGEVMTRNEDELAFNVGISKSFIAMAVKEAVKDIATDIKIEAIESIKYNVITEEFGETVKQALYDSIKEQTDELMKDFMNKDITYKVETNYWGNDKEETKKCKEIIQDRIDKYLTSSELKEDFKKHVEFITTRSTRNQVEDFGKQLKRDLEKRIDSMFNQTVKDNIGDALFKVVTDNETYKNLKENIEVIALGNK